MSDPDQGRDKNSERGWSLAARASGENVRVELGLPDLDGKPVTAVITLDRAEARAFARTLLAAAGDATERTFSPPRKR